MKTTNNCAPIKEFNYNNYKSQITINGKTYPIDATWNSRKYRESHFSRIQHRDRSLEHRLMMINAMLIDYHYNRPTEYFYDITSGNWNEETLDENPEESKSILLEAKSYGDMVLQSISQSNWKSKIEYLKLSLSLMLEIADQLENFDIHLSPYGKYHALVTEEDKR